MSAFQKITAIVRLKKLNDVERQLKACKVKGITVTRVKGFGEWNPDSYFGYEGTMDRLVGHVRLELFVDATRVEQLVDVIAQAAYTGEPGDGVIAALPVEQFLHVRSYIETTRTSATDEVEEE